MLLPVLLPQGCGLSFFDSAVFLLLSNVCLGISLVPVEVPDLFMV
jgi:hypothetical protein